MTYHLRAALLDARHGFFTRRGGVSDGPYASLNASLGGGDDPARVRANRARAAEAVGAAPGRLLGMRQVHGVEVAVAAEPWAIGDGPAADAGVTTTPGLALAIVTADCAPVLFADARAGVIGAAHAGWRGAAAGVLEATLDAMERLGARRDRIAAAIGPCIDAASYEVGPDLRDGVLAPSPDAARFLMPGRDGAHWQFDLRGYCAARLAAAGVAAVDHARADTYAEADRFFSHRRRTHAGGGAIGHQVSVIALPDR